MVLDEICVNLIVLAEHEIPYQQLLTLAQGYFPPGDTNEDKSFKELILLKMEYLITNKILFVVE